MLGSTADHTSTSPALIMCQLSMNKIFLWLRRSRRGDGKEGRLPSFEVEIISPDSYPERKWREGSEALPADLYCCHGPESFQPTPQIASLHLS